MFNNMPYGNNMGYPNNQMNDYYRNMINGNNQFNPNYNQPQFITKQVTNIDEAKASLIDGISTNLFIDYNAEKIYLKRLNNNGMSDFFTFSLDKIENNKSDPLQEINQRLINIESKLTGGKNANNEQSNANDATASDAKDATEQSASLQ